MNETILKIKAVYDAQGTNEAKKAFNELRSAVKGASGETAKANGIFTNFGASLTRIAKLRLLRGIIRTITQAFKEGTQNIYAYSQALGSADASHFASTMDALASSFLYMKNSIGAVVAPLLTALLPTIQTIVDWFVTATQVVAQFFAILGGQSTYTVAKKNATAWKDVGTAVGGAAAAAKEYQNTILSFDEIHALNDVPTSGGGGGGGASAPDYGSMFEEMEIPDTWFTRMVKGLKENFNDILAIVTSIGSALLGWKIASKVTDFFNSLGVGKAGRVAAGITIAITGFVIEASGAYGIGYNGVNLKDLVKTVIGGALGIAGSALTFSALGLGGGMGATIGFAISLAITVAGIKIGEMDKYLDTTVRSTESFQRLKGIIDSSINSQNTFITQADELRHKVDLLNGSTSDYAASANLAYGAALIERIKELAGKTELTADETAELQTKIEILNGLGLDGIQVEFNTLTGKVTANWQEIDKNIEKMIELAKTSAKFDLLKEAYRQQFELEVEHQRLLDDEAYAVEQLEQAQADFDKVQRKSADGTIVFDKETKAAREALTTAKQAVDENRKAQQDLQVAMDKNAGTIRTLEGNTNNYATATNNTKNAILDLDRMKPAFSGITDGIGLVGTQAYYAWANVKALSDELGHVAQIGLAGGVNLAVEITKRANGGFVNGYANGGIIPRFDGGGINSAQLFLANENGMPPEMIGTIGNRTAVANQGQMVEAMAEGVYRAMSNVMSNGNSNTEVNVYMNDEVVARAADRGNRSLNRRFNVSLA